MSALDVSVQAQVLQLLERLRRELDLTYVFISHDLGVVQYLCDRVMVMYCGRVVEEQPSDSLFATPRHPYVETLIASAPSLVPGTLAPPSGRGEIADPVNRPPGCEFHPRCAYAEPVCRTERPPLAGPASARAACHFAGRLPLKGVAAPHEHETAADMTPRKVAP